MSIIMFLGSSAYFSVLRLHITQVSSSQYALCSQSDVYNICYEGYFKHKRETKAIMKDNKQEQ